jgi:mono/diheme cytochrome c family protein
MDSVKLIETKNKRPQVNRIAAICAGIIVLCGAGNSLAADTTNGQTIYSQHCTGCHGQDGSGTMPGMPDFARGEALFQPDPRIADAVRSGKGVMPGFQGLLSEDDILDVVAYLRTFR